MNMFATMPIPASANTAGSTGDSGARYGAGRIGPGAAEHQQRHPGEREEHPVGEHRIADQSSVGVGQRERRRRHPGSRSSVIAKFVICRVVDE